MAAKRISKSAINWAFVAERVPEAQKADYLAFKAKSDGYLRRVLSYPEQTPAIDWPFYKSRIAVPGLVDEFEKNFKALKVPYPADTQTTQINAVQAETEKNIKKFISTSKSTIAEYQKELDKLNAIMPIEEMTMEDWKDAFPDQAWDYKNPTMWPHDEPTPEGFIEPPLTDH